MALAGMLVLIAVAAALFQFLGPWWLTPLASDWGLLDDTLLITLVITGVFCVAAHNARNMASGRNAEPPWS